VTPPPVTSPPVTIPTESRPLLIWWICLGAIALVLLNAARAWPEVGNLLLLSDNDDLMRLVQVRDWLGGQDWFDTRQYRVLPPEGISMHWSRYVDAGIAAVLVPASWLLPMPQAELLTAVVWPSLLACLMVLLIGLGTNRLFGPLAALGALVVFLTWSKLRGDFTPPRLDHHNVQMICATALFYLAALPGRDRLNGALAGLVTALSLAVGLELLPVLLLVPAWMTLRHAFDQPGAGGWLLGYGTALTLAAPLAMAGQTPPSAWGVMHCDVLAPPVLALAAIGVVAALVPVLAARALQGPIVRILATAAIAALGLWLAAPLLSPCLAGPFADVPPEVRTLIESRVVEALSVREMFQLMPDVLLASLLPAVVILVPALALTLLLWPRLDAVQGAALGLALLVALSGLAVALMQVRGLTLTAPVLPLLGGFLVHAFQRLERANPMRLPAFVLLALATPTAVEEATRWLHGLTVPQIARTAPQALPGGSDCRNAEALTELADLPPSVLFSSLNLGTRILAYTPHSATSVPYHRSPAAFWNGIAGLESEANLRAALASSQADYVVLCASEPQKPYARKILDGDLPDWLTDATGDRRKLRIYRVDHARLAKASGP